MKFSRIVRLLAQLTAAVFFTSPIPTQAQSSADKTWTATRLSMVTNLDVPECVVFDPAHNTVFVSNISSKQGDYWSDDGKGFISRLDPDGAMKNLRWLDSTLEHSINAPKGMCVLNNWLYFTDNARLLRCKIGKNIEPASAPEKVELPPTKKLNDLATDGKCVLVSDIELGKVFRSEPSGKFQELPSPKSVNGVTFHRGKIFAVSWELHEVYELDTAGKNPPKPFGLDSQFKNLDGIEVLDDGTFLVSDFTGNKVSTISPDRKTVQTLVEIESPADIGIDRKHGILYVPQLTKNQAVLFRLNRR